MIQLEKKNTIAKLVAPRKTTKNWDWSKKVHSSKCVTVVTLAIFGKQQMGSHHTKAHPSMQCSSKDHVTVTMKDRVEEGIHVTRK